MTTIKQLPLEKLFYQLRKFGLQLGIDDYELFLRSIQGGYCGKNLHDLRNLCSTLWVKNEDDARIFDALFLEGIKLSSTYELDFQGNPINKDLDHPIVQNIDQNLLNQEENIKDEKRNEDRIEPQKQVNSFRITSKINSIDENWSNLDFSFSKNYFPVTIRQMKQAWRHLRKMVRCGGSPFELDVHSTIDKAASRGILYELILSPRRVNKARLVLIIDQDGSMTPFNPLIRQLIETSYAGRGQLARTDIYYFHDYPDNYLYIDIARINPQLISEVIRSFDSLTSVLIISDGGAARGSFDENRIARTEKFIEMLCVNIKNFAWLNPMPKDRWEGSSAAKISEKINMFDMSRHGLESAIKLLRGQHIQQM